MPGGRPTKYNFEALKPLLAEAEERGMYREQLAHHLGIVKTTMDEWIQIHPEFSVAVDKVRIACEARLAQMLDDLASGAAEKGNGGVAVFIAKNVLGWKDKQEVVSHNTNNNTTTVEVVIGGGVAPQLPGAEDVRTLPPTT